MSQSKNVNREFGSITVLDGINNHGGRLRDVGYPIVSSDGATKEYVDDVVIGQGYYPGIGLSLNTTGHVFSVNASQTQIIAVGNIGTGSWSANVITVPYGGTGAVSYTPGRVLTGNGTGAVQSSAPVYYLNSMFSSEAQLNVLNTTDNVSGTSTAALVVSGAGYIAKNLIVAQGISSENAYGSNSSFSNANTTNMTVQNAIILSTTMSNALMSNTTIQNAIILSTTMSNALVSSASVNILTASSGTLLNANLTSATVSGGLVVSGSTSLVGGFKNTGGFSNSAGNITSIGLINNNGNINVTGGITATQNVTVASISTGYGTIKSLFTSSITATSLIITNANTINATVNNLVISTNFTTPIVNAGSVFVSGGLVTGSASGTSASFTVATIGNLYVPGVITMTNASANASTMTNLVNTNQTSANLTVVGITAGTLNALLIKSTFSSVGNLTSAVSITTPTLVTSTVTGATSIVTINASIGTLTGTGVNVLNVSTSNITSNNSLFTNETINGTLTATNITTVSLVGSNATFASAILSSATVSNFYAINSTIPNLIASNITNSSLLVTAFCTIANMRVSNATIGTISGNNIGVGSVTVGNLNVTINGTIPNLSTNNVTCNSLIVTSTATLSNLYQKGVTTNDIQALSIQAPSVSSGSKLTSLSAVITTSTNGTFGEWSSNYIYGDTFAGITTGVTTGNATTLRVTPPMAGSANFITSTSVIALGYVDNTIGKALQGQITFDRQDGSRYGSIYTESGTSKLVIANASISGGGGIGLNSASGHVRLGTIVSALDTTSVEYASISRTGGSILSTAGNAFSVVGGSVSREISISSATTGSITEGGNISISNTTGIMVLTPASTLGNVTVTLPTGVTPGRLLTIASTRAITSVTFGNAFSTLGSLATPNRFVFISGLWYNV